MGYSLTSIKCLGCAYAVLILSVNFCSAGLLQAIREAAVPKDMDYKLPIESIQTPSPSPSQFSSISQVVSPSKAEVTPAEEASLLSSLQTSLSKLSSAIQERADVTATRYVSKPKQCKPGDLLCHAGLASSLLAGSGSGTKMQTELSKAIIKSFGTMMSDMVNSTISRSLVDFMGKHGTGTGETLGEEHQAMVHMAAGVLQTVSVRVIKAFTFFTQLAISGAMWDLFNQLMNGVNSAYNEHQKSVAELRGAEALRRPASKIPKPSQPQEFGSLVNSDPVQTLLNAGALTSLSYPVPGFDLMSSLKSNLFSGEHNNLVRKRGAAVLTPYGLLTKKM